MKGIPYSAEDLADMKAGAKLLFEQRTGTTPQELANEAAEDDMTDDDVADDVETQSGDGDDESSDEANDEASAAGEDDGEDPDEDAEEKHSEDSVSRALGGAEHATLPVHRETVPLATLRPSRDAEGFRFQHSRTQYEALQPEPPALESSETEGLLNGLIAECASLLRDVAFRSACQAQDVDDRIRFLSAAEGLARTAATVGDTVSRLRNNGAESVHEHRQLVTVEHVVRETRGEGGRGKSRRVSGQ